jgi:threonine synthase
LETRAVSFVTKLTCVHCAAEHQPGPLMTCPACGPADGILDVQYDLPRVAAVLTRDAFAARPLSHWRYIELLPLDSVPPALADIGGTPLIDTPRLAANLGVARLRLKDDSRSASGSFKDRASSVGVARAVQAGFGHIACASTGNAASSLACCAAAAGMCANIFVSEAVPAAKLAQLLAYGARVFKVRGTYADAYELCEQACETYGWYNRNCAVNPYLVEGKKTAGLEIAEACTADPPDWVVCSVGDGCSIAGVWKGLAQMRALGLIDWQPRMLGVQAAGVAPICAAAEHGQLPVAASGTTYADSINVPVPRNWRKALRAIDESNGALVTVSDEQMQEAVRVTGRLTGVFAEPAAAAAVAGVAEARRQNVIAAGASVVAIITGNGLKDIDGALRAVGAAHDIAPDFDDVQRVIDAAGGS